MDGAALIEPMGMTQEEFSRYFKGSAVKRTKRRGRLRNVAVALGNRGAPEAVPVLAVALNDEEPLVQGHATWMRLRRTHTGFSSEIAIFSPHTAVRATLDPYVPTRHVDGLDTLRRIAIAAGPGPGRDVEPPLTTA